MVRPELPGTQVHQVLLEILQGTRSIKRIGSQSWDEVYAGLVPFDAEGWAITFFNDCSHLDYCHECTSPDGRKGEFDSWYDAGTEPVMLLDDCKRFELEQILKTL
jgi:hypothetical protein